MISNHWVTVPSKATVSDAKVATVKYYRLEDKL
jgi:hypothetical protein